MTPQVVSAQAFTGDHAAQHFGDEAFTETPRNVGFLARCRVVEKQRTWPEGSVPPCFAFSTPVSEGLIRELAFKNSYRKSRAHEITRSHPKVLGLLDYHRLGEPSPGKIVVFFSVAIGSPGPHTGRSYPGGPRSSRLARSLDSYSRAFTAAAGGSYRRTRSGLRPGS